MLFHAAGTHLSWSQNSKLRSYTQAGLKLDLKVWLWSGARIAGVDDAVDSSRDSIAS